MPALLPVIYLTFVSLGLPDSALGAAWPSMYGGLGAGVSWVGLVSAIICLGTIVSSVTSVSVVRRLGTGKTSAVSVVMTAAGLMGFSLCTEFWQLCLWAVPYGLGAGAIDAALNSYVAIHYASRHMNWLHCMWGVGASAGPMIVARCLVGSTWNVGFRVLGVIQLVIAAVVTASLPFWNRVGEKVGEKSAGRTASDEDVRPSDASRRELLRVPGVRECLICFFCYCAFESTCGAWAASYCTLARGVSAGDAATWASLFYVGITAGRAVSGFLTMRLNDSQLIRLGQALIAVGLVLLLAPLPNAAAMMGLMVCGLGCAPIYPSIIHSTPENFGASNALALTGLQMAFAYVGSLVMSPLFGVLAEGVSLAIYPFYLAALLAVMALMAKAVNRVCRRA